MRIMRTAGVAVTAAVALTAAVLSGPIAGTALAKDGDVIRRGPCSGASDWKLKLSDEDGRIEVEFEVDQNVVGDVWRVRIRHEGELVFAGRRTTKGESGSFEVRIVEPNRAGDDVFRGRAVNATTGETCVGRAVWTG
jgi:hypothetical protein